jgi:hypothetical protein
VVSEDSFRSGDPVLGEKCPGCHWESVVYNGNYFCTHCEWAMGEGGRPARIIKAYLLQRLLKAEAANDQIEIARLEGYLEPYRKAKKEKPVANDIQKRNAVLSDLEALVNKHSLENGSGTPDYILATYLWACIETWNASTKTRDRWWGFDAKIGGVVPAVDEPSDG